MRHLILSFSVMLLTLTSMGQFSEIATDPVSKPFLDTYKKPPFLEDSTNQWVEKTLKKLSPEERIAQLFMVAAYSNRNADHVSEIEKLVKKYKIGGLIFFQGGPVRQANLTNRYQEMADVPLMIAMDAEWGLGMRLDSVISYPRQMALGSVQDNNLVYQMGQDIAEQCRRLGVHVSFSPVLDVNNNPSNPVINSRSFGEDKYNVAEKGRAYMKGLQDGKVLACGKHFPGHGDTDKDSHKSLPVINHDRSRLDSIELYPFRELINAGLGSVMVAHLNVPALDTTGAKATTLSPQVVNGLLKNELGFNGLVFTDALNMKGVSAYYEPGDVELEALLAGNDVLLFAEDVPKAIENIQGAIEDGRITQAEVDARCRKILQTKLWLGLNKRIPVKTENLVDDLNHSKYDLILREIAKASVTVIRNTEHTIPVKSLDSLRIASVSIGAAVTTPFQKELMKYAEVDPYSIGKNPSFDDIIELNEKLSGYDLILTGIHNTSQYPGKNFGITNPMSDVVNLLQKKGNVVLCYFGNPYGLKHIEGVGNIQTVIVSYHDATYHQRYTAQALFGAFSCDALLPVSVPGIAKSGSGESTMGLGRFEYSSPEAVNINSSWLAQIDSIALEGIKEEAYPGCQVLVAKSGKVIYTKNFGFHTYDQQIPVSDESVYDLASITKIAATTFSIMKLTDEGKFSLDYSLCDYLPEMVDTNSNGYSDIIMREMLSHMAGLSPWIPFYKQTLANGYPMYNYYSLVPSETYPYEVAENLYIHKDYPTEIYHKILQTPLRSEKTYKYSDLGYYFLQKIVEKQSGTTLNRFAEQEFYKPMGLVTTTYLPKKKFSKYRIVPTENDKTFRKQMIHGDVHDPGAAMMGGVGGHAGLFSNANDLAKIMQCFMQYGEYGGERYLSEATVKEFVKCQYCTDDNRRGAGFDKPVREGEGGPTCTCVSYESFGHTGFTGTMAWADPDEEIVYVFLSNRIHPDASNYKLIHLDIRTRIMEVVYDAVEKSKVEKDS
jgi:beta-N-acetylhexosaminidase